MTEEEYLNQEMYFSESQQEFVTIESMTPPYARNAFNKLLREFGEGFTGSNLYHSFHRYLRPQQSEMRRRLRKDGMVSYWWLSKIERARVRNMMYRAARRENLNIVTRSKNEFLTAEVVTPFNVTVRGRSL